MTAVASDSHGSLGKSLVRLAPATLIVQLLGFAASLALAARLGATTMTDAYYLAYSVPLFAYVVLLAAVRQGAIPLLTGAASRQSAQQFATSCSELLTATIVAATALSMAVTAVMVFLLPAVAGGGAHLAALTRTYILELSPYAVSGATLGALGAILAVRGEFAMPALVLGWEPFLKGCLVMLFPALGAQALVIGSLAGNLLAVTVLWELVRRSGVALRPARFRSSPLVRTVLKLTIPLAVGATVLQFNPLIDRAMAAGLGSGNVTALELGVRLFAAPAGLLGAILIAPIATTWSARLARDGWGAVGQSFSRVVAAVVILVPPLAMAGFLVRHDLVALMYKSQAYTAVAVSRTADVLGWLLFGLLPEILFVPLAALFVIHGDSVFPMKVALANGVLNVVLDVMLRGPFAVSGIALSTTITYIILCAVYFWKARRRWPLDLRSVRRPLAVSGASCIAIFLLCATVFGLSNSSGSRSDELVVVAMVLGMAGLIHGSLVMVGGVARLTGMPVRPGWRPLAALRR